MWIVWRYMPWSSLEFEDTEQSIYWEGDSIGFCEIFDDKDKALKSANGDENIISHVTPA